MVSVLFKFHSKSMESMLDIYSARYYTVDVKLAFHYFCEVTL